MFLGQRTDMSNINIAATQFNNNMELTKSVFVAQREHIRCACRVFAAIAPAFGRHARIPHESMGAAALRALLVLPGVSDHPAVAAALAAALDTGPAWPQVGLPHLPLR